MGLDIREPLIPQIEKALVDVLADIVKLKASQTHVERLQEKINELLKEKKPLDDAKLKAEKAKTKAENDVNGNAEAILRLDKEYKDLQQECEGFMEELNKQSSFGSFKILSFNKREILTYIEDKSFFYRDNSYNMISFRFIIFKIKQLINIFISKQRLEKDTTKNKSIKYYVIKIYIETGEF